MADPTSFRNKIAGAGPDADVTLTVVRNGGERQVHAKLAELKPPDRTQRQGSIEPSSAGRVGIVVQPMTPELAAELKLPGNTQGLVVMSVDPAGAAADAGIKTGDVIAEVNRQPVKSVDDMRAALNKSGSRPILILLNRGGHTLFVTVSARG